MLQNTDCYGDGFIFENLIVNFSSPNGTLDRKVTTLDNSEYYITIRNNIATCHLVHGTPKLQYYQSIKRFLLLTLERSTDSSRLINEYGYKMFAYIPNGIDATVDFRKTINETNETIFGDSINFCSEWKSELTTTVKTISQGTMTEKSNNENTIDKRYVFNFN